MTLRRLTAVAAVLTASGSALAQPPATAPTGKPPSAAVTSTPTTTPPATTTATVVPGYPTAAASGCTGTGTNCPISVFDGNAGGCGRLTDLAEPKQARVWLTTDYVLWFVQTVNVPPLIETVPGALTQNLGTALPAGTAQRLFPETRKFEFGGASGVRLSGGFRLNENWGVDASGFWLERRSLSGEAFGDGSVNSNGISRSYIQAGTGTPISLYSNLPGQYAGGAAAFADSQVWGFQVNARRDTYRLFCDKNDFLAGFRYLELEESVVINERATFPDGGTLVIQDAFRTQNRFYGGQGGFHMQWNGKRFGADLITKMGIGSVNQRVEAVGSNTFTSAAGVVDRENGGLYARGANFGVFERDKFAFTGELNVNVGYNVTEHCRLQVGYSITYLSSVMRAGEVIDPQVNDSAVRYVANPFPNNLPLPAFDWGRASDFWVQGINFGLHVQY